MTTFSLILSTGVLLILADTIIHMVLYFTYPRFRNWLLTRPYFNYMNIIGSIAVTSTLLALTYQLYYNLPVCILCWWQRIFIFPIDIIVITSIIMKNKMNHVTIGVLAFFGSLVSVYHYYYHFQAWVLGNAVSMPCEQGGLLPACIENNGVLTFGFVTIPLMALIIQVSIIWWCYVAYQAAKKHE